MELGCSTILYGGHDLSVALDRIAHAGYRAIELGAIARMAPHLKLGSNAVYYEGVRAMVEERGLEIESIGGSGNFGEAIAARISSTRIPRRWQPTCVRSPGNIQHGRRMRK